MSKLTKNIVAIFIVGIIVFIISNSIFGGFQNKSTSDLLINFAHNELYSFVLSFSNIAFFDFMERQKWKEGDKIKRFVFGIIGSIVVTLIGLFFLRALTAMYLEGQTFSVFLSKEKWNYYSFGLWITLTIVITFHAIYFYKKTQEKKVKESQIVAKTETAKFESLKSQLDPHFLFNSLNVLTSLISENPNKAEKFTTKLSKIYRYVLEQKDKDLTSVEEELRFAESYMQLLEMRFEDAVLFKVQEGIDSEELKIVPLSLQLLLENAVKHNVITSSEPLEINIYIEEGYLIIENNINPKTSLGKSTKVGLKNIKQRYALITNKSVEITALNKVFKVKLPLLDQNIKIMKTDYLNDNKKYIRAKKRVDELKGFYGSLISYVFVIPFLVFVNYRTSWEFQWFWFPAFGWGLGLAIQAFMAFGYGYDWEDKKIREIMEKDKL
jgi:sensor histidine kinase YesM